jgi:hypothetical protein
LHKSIAVLLGLSIILGGCSSKEEDIYQNSIEKGLDAVAEENFNKAEGFFEVALDTKEDDAKAKAYFNQVNLILEANKLVDENRIQQAIQSLDKSINVKQGSKIISGVSKDKIEEFSLLLENQRIYSSTLAEAKKLNKSGEFEESNRKLDFLLKEELTQFTTIKDEANQLKIENENAIKQAEIDKATAQAEAAAVAKAKAEEEARKEKEAAKANDPMTWAPGVKEKFEQEFYDAGYADTKASITYKNGYIYNNQGFYEVWAQWNGEYRYVVVVNVKTGWYHG